MQMRTARCRSLIVSESQRFRRFITALFRCLISFTASTDAFSLFSIADIEASSS